MTANSRDSVDKAERNGASINVSTGNHRGKSQRQSWVFMNNDKLREKYINCDDATVINDSGDDDANEGSDDVGFNPMTKTDGGFEPPDGGWGWVVAAGCFFINTLSSLIGPCFGVLFSSFLLDLGTSSTTTAWIFNTFLCLWNGCGMFARPVIKEVGWRPSAMFGALLNAAAFFTTAFAPSAEFLFFSYSVIGGIGGGILGHICFTILPHFFYKHRGIANGIMMTGVCMGQFIGPPIIRYLQDEYGFRGATLISGAFMLNVCAGALVLHPVEWHLKKVSTNDNSTGRKFTPNSLAQRTITRELSRGMVKSQSGLCLGESLGALEIEISELGIETQEHEGYSSIRRYSYTSSSSIRTRRRTMTVSDGESEELRVIVEKVTTPDKDELLRESENCLQITWRILRLIVSSAVSDLSQLTSPTVFILATGATCAVNGYLNFIMMVPFAMQAAGHSLQASAWCVSVAAVTNMVTRLASSMLADCPRFNVKFSYIFGVLLMAVTMLTLPFVMEDLPSIMIVMGLWGCGVGTCMSVYNLVLLNIVGLERLASVFGTSNFMVAVGFLVSGPIVGYIRDSSGSYGVSIWVLSGLMSMTLILWGFLPLAVAHEKKKKTEEQETSKGVKKFTLDP